MRRAQQLWITTLLLGLASAAPGGHHETAAPGAPADDAAPRGQVARSVFTTGIEAREPLDALTSLTTDQERVVFFTELTGLAGQTVRHRWEQAGVVLAEIEFEVGAPRWRVWSSKRLPTGPGPDWTVSVVDAEGRRLGSRTIGIVEPGVATGAEAATPPDATDPE